jgi:hypothetical protein
MAPAQQRSTPRKSGVLRSIRGTEAENSAAAASIAGRETLGGRQKPLVYRVFGMAWRLLTNLRVELWAAPARHLVEFLSCCLPSAHFRRHSTRCNR